MLPDAFFPAAPSRAVPDSWTREDRQVEGCRCGVLWWGVADDYRYLHLVVERTRAGRLRGVVVECCGAVLWCGVVARCCGAVL